MLRQALDVARRDLDFGITAAVGGALRARVLRLRAYRDRENLAVLHDSFSEARILRERRGKNHLNPSALRIRFTRVPPNERDPMRTLRIVVAAATVMAGSHALAHGRLAEVS